MQSVENQQDGVSKVGEVTVFILLRFPRETLKRLAFRNIYDAHMAESWPYCRPGSAETI